MRTLTLPLQAASPRARLVFVENEHGVGLWATDPDVRTISNRTVQSGFIDRRHAVELAEFLHACAEPAYEPASFNDKAQWLIHHLSDPSAVWGHFDLRLNRGGSDSRPQRPQGLLRRFSREGREFLLTALNIPVLTSVDAVTPRHPIGAYLGRVPHTARWLSVSRPRQD